ncbi:hypothetical protein CN925_11530 [Bacillus sp. AFS055030]|nr:hypothetical protein CN925_11530 [Bacillus sp. AFS055030]
MERKGAGLLWEMREGLDPTGGAEEAEAKESRPMESEHPVMEITETQLTYQKLIFNNMKGF